MNPYTKQKQIHRYRKQTYDYQRGKRGKKRKIRGIGLTYTSYYTYKNLHIAQRIMFNIQ